MGYTNNLYCTFVQHHVQLIDTLRVLFQKFASYPVQTMDQTQFQNTPWISLVIKCFTNCMDAVDGFAMRFSRFFVALLLSSCFMAVNLSWSSGRILNRFSVLCTFPFCLDLFIIPVRFTLVFGLLGFLQKTNSQQS